MRGLTLVIATLAGCAHAVNFTRLAEAYDRQAQPVESANLLNLGAGRGPDADQQV